MDISNLSLIQHHPIFEGMTEEEISLIMKCFQFTKKEYMKNEYIILEGDEVQSVGLILKGTVLMEKDDPFGNNYFVTELREREIFAEPFMGSYIQHSSVNYKTLSNCSVLFFQYQSMWKPCNKNCPCHSKFTENLMNLLAMKTRSMMAKIEILSKKSLRDRILTFLHIIKTHQDIVGFHVEFSSHQLKENEIFVPFNHTEMAEYLCVNRSAFVRELSKMKKEGVIGYEGRAFRLM